MKRREFARLVEANEVAHPGLEVSRITAKLLSEIRRQNRRGLPGG
ncbi:oxidoreductase [Klebsiella michiganensis]|uniref:Oxidoreductase n=1 Tax=Klebsiella michiganensis TaxID=1134687 RepID=A0A7H4PHG1_9ENTR|nr:oxidoreductase [Klebsiella michiganensis]